MHENEFEKRVQQKMEELQFAPSDAVWKKVDREINEKKKRRPVFWLFFFLGLMLLGGGFYFVANNRLGKVDKLNELSGLKESKKVEELNGLKADEVADKLNADKNEKKEALDKKKENDNEDKLKSSGELKKLNGLNSLKRKKNLQADKVVNSIATRGNKSKSFNERKKNINTEKNELAENGSKNNNDENVINKNDNEENVVTKETGKDIQDSSDNKTANAITENKKNIVSDNKTVIADSSSDKKIARNNIKAMKSSSWKIGFHFDPGISSIRSGLFNSALSVNPANSPTTGAGAPGTNSPPSKIETGFSASVGISVSKTISKRLFFSTGINYHYYSTSISTGKFVDSGAYVYSSYNNSNLTSQVNGYYVSGKNKYVNNYHFLELPLLLGWQINKGDKIPFIWEAGASVSYLINSNALHFDPIKNIYYKNSDLFNKIQLNVSTSLMASFHVNKNELLVGPQVQYGMTRLLKNSTGNTEHLLFAGIKFAYILNKK